MSYLPTIGLEIHVGLSTETKMFCSCPNDPYESHPNVNVCPICLAHPGTLPIPNKKAIDSVILLGLAINGKIADKTHFDRKSYFYPDLPKGYQISQYEHPLVSGGSVKDIKVTRVHLEEDTGSLVHKKSQGKGGYSLVDYNRAGVPLMELVTEPDIKSADKAVEFAAELQLILRYLGISDADMDKGHMRIEANVSVAPEGEELGEKVEVKNLNSFKAVHGAIEYETKRQAKALKNGEKVTHETRGWDDEKKKTVPQRMKESAHDYRYFPEPDIPPIEIYDEDIQRIRGLMPELPAQKRKRFAEEFGITPDQAGLLAEDKAGASFFEETVSEFKAFDGNIKSFDIVYNYFSSDLRGLMKDRSAVFSDLKMTPEHFAHLAFMVHEGDLSSRLAKDMLVKMFETGKDPETLKSEGGIEVVSDEGELEKIAGTIIEENEKAVEDYRKGKETAIKFLVGQIMAKTRGQADPEVAEKIFIKLLG